MIERTIYPNANEMLTMLKSRLSDQPELLETIKTAWTDRTELLTPIANQEGRLLRFIPDEFEQFTTYLDGIITHPAEITGSEFVKQFDACFKSSDTQAQVGLLKYFYDQDRSRLIASGQAPVAIHSMTSAFGTEYKIAKATCMGTHTPWVNSDHYRIGQAGSPLIVVLSDGYTETIYDKENKEYLGKLFASRVTSEIEDALAEAFRLNIKTPNSEFFNNITNLTANQLVDKLKRQNPELENLTGIHRTISLTNLFLKKEYDCTLTQRGVIDKIGGYIALHREARRLYSNNSAKLAEDTRNYFINLVKHSPSELFDLLFGIEEAATEQVYNRAQQSSGGAGTLSFAVDLGEQIKFVSKGDSAILVINQDGSIERVVGINNSPAVMKTFAKAAIAGFVMISDGIASRTKLDVFKERIATLKADPEAIVREAMKFSKLDDDKTVIAVQLAA